MPGGLPLSAFTAMLSANIRSATALEEQVQHGEHQSQRRVARPPSQPFRRRALHSVAVLDNYLYLEGGEISSFVNGQMMSDQSSLTVNNTLSLPLDKSWELSNAPYTTIPDHEPPPMDMFALWADENDRVLYRYGGEKAFNGNVTSTENRHLWKFSPDGAGVGTWSIQAALDQQFFDGLRQGTRAASVFCEGLGIYVGGFGDRSTDIDFQDVTWPYSVTIPGMITFTTGQAVCVTGFGPSPMVMMLGGWSADFQTIAIYDQVSKRWLQQQASGSVPRSRGNYCAVAVRGPQGTVEIFIHGGNSDTSSTMSDTYALSLPGFTWFKVDVSAPPRMDHACAVIGKKQMLISGGIPVQWEWKPDDEWIGAHKILDLSELKLTDRYDAGAAAYEPAKVIKDWYYKGLDVCEGLCSNLCPSV
ncbi:hypothetical protein CDD81_5636 [Ophiocordyceps australis]|uniref:Kelch repeat protein n=1 Tax=Ophiocordyceps australis TaxID=1399860 RepID=A0A2C5Y2D5_9HYPO|nr:hypothetical protein CDD81_5636 [Ophiocordyceps australis]